MRLQQDILYILLAKVAQKVGSIKNFFSGDRAAAQYIFWVESPNLLLVASAYVTRPRGLGGFEAAGFPL